MLSVTQRSLLKITHLLFVISGKLYMQRGSGYKGRIPIWKRNLSSWHSTSVTQQGLAASQKSESCAWCHHAVQVAIPILERPTIVTDYLMHVQQMQVAAWIIIFDKQRWTRLGSQELTFTVSDWRKKHACGLIRPYAIHNDEGSLNLVKTFLKGWWWSAQNVVNKVTELSVNKTTV